LFDRGKQLSALRALWKYNFVPDCGPFREKFKQGRWYAAAGDAGLIMCSWPKGGQNPNFHKHWQYMYFNECMTGFEWQAASHMIWEGHDQPDLLEAGLAVSRSIHDRYNAALRNPYNEIECSDHYSRAMASYGVFQAVCGFQCHGPKGMLEFAPRLKPAEFRAAFIAAEGWGTVEQKRSGKAQKNRITLMHGQIQFETLRVDVPEARTIKTAEVSLGGNRVKTAFAQDGNRVRITLIESLQLSASQTLEIEIV
jgi:non-lysosomal glucosylceramidase